MFIPMKKYLTAILLSIILIPNFIIAQDKQKESFVYVANWNLENLFDVFDDSLTNDNEFLPTSKKQWTEEKFMKKIDNLSDVMHFMNDGKGPDIIGFEEVENMMVLKYIVYKFRNRDYIVVHRDSPDPRGIDVGLIYDRNMFDIQNVEKIPVGLPNGKPTRDILHVTLIYKADNDLLQVYVNHWPSRLGGVEATENKRDIAAETLKKNVDSVLQVNSKNKIIILGDFNDGPVDESVLQKLKVDTTSCSKITLPDENSLYNLSYSDYKLGLGTYRYKKEWYLFDQIIISGSLLERKSLGYFCDSFEIVKPSFMLEEEGNDSSGPLPTYYGNKYLGGYSDHFPVGACFELFERKNK